LLITRPSAVKSWPLVAEKSKTWFQTFFCSKPGRKPGFELARTNGIWTLLTDKPRTTDHALVDNVFSTPFYLAILVTDRVRRSVTVCHEISRL